MIFHWENFLAMEANLTQESAVSSKMLTWSPSGDKKLLLLIPVTTCWLLVQSILQFTVAFFGTAELRADPVLIDD